MNKTPSSDAQQTVGAAEAEDADDLAPEYRFDYANARPNRFAAATQRVAEEKVVSPVVVALDADVAIVFSSAEAVNNVLRALIQTMPTTAGR